MSTVGRVKLTHEGERMGEGNFWIGLRQFIGGMGFRLFLWMNKLTEQQYFEQVAKSEPPGLTADELKANIFTLSTPAEYYRGGKEAFQRVVDEWPKERLKVQAWANNCAVHEEQHRRASLVKTNPMEQLRP